MSGFVHGGSFSTPIQLGRDCGFVNDTLPKRLSSEHRAQAYSALIERPAGGLSPAAPSLNSGPAPDADDIALDVGPIFSGGEKASIQLFAIAVLLTPVRGRRRAGVPDHLTEATMREERTATKFDSVAFAELTARLDRQAADIADYVDANEPERELIMKLSKLVRHGHKLADLRVRVDGCEYTFEADWLCRFFQSEAQKKGAPLCAK